jgi:uncharacterized protein DUF4350
MADGHEAMPDAPARDAASAAAGTPQPAARRGWLTRSPVRLLVGLVVLFIVVSVVIDRIAPTPSGPEGSSYATAPEGAAAYAELLHRAGHPVTRVRTPVAERPLDPGTTLVVLDPEQVAPEEARAIGRFVRAGGRLVAGGALARWLGRVLDVPPEWAPSAPGRATVVVPVPESAGVSSVAFAEGGRWDELGGALPILATPDGPVAAVSESGAGRVVLLADASPLYNRELARADDAAFGLAVVGAARRPVAFLETVHGYGVSRGFGGLPGNVKWALIGLALTALVAIWAAGRRFGPAEDPDTEPPPPRVDYVDALAAALVRAKPDKEEERSK